MQAWHRVNGRHLYEPVDPTIALTDEQKVAWPNASIAKPARLIRASCASCIASAVYELVLIATSEGAMAADASLVRMNVSVIVEQDGRRAGLLRCRRTL